MVWYTYQMEDILTSITDHHLAAFQTAESLETALMNQKGFVSYYFLDGDTEWLRQLGIYRQIFNERLKKAHDLAGTEQERQAILQIETEYRQYIDGKDRVIDFHKTGNQPASEKLHQSVRKHFFRILDLCEHYKSIYAENIKNAKKSSHERARESRFIAWTAIIIEICLAVLLAFLLANHILGPIRQLTLEANREGKNAQTNNEIKALSRSVYGLIENADQAQSELIKSREHLLQAEKLALVGKLAAGMAHSIRNPFTSVKMRLFSLGRSLELSDYQKEDFDVISEEIRHIDTVVQNFLEFSRPPKLKMQRISPSTVVDLSIQLLEHRLKSYDVTVKVVRKKPLPMIQADPEQLKEVLVNLVVNACEAMEKGGLIVIQEEITRTDTGKNAVVIRVRDNGPGIPESTLDKILHPFFTTKEEGTGLGLSIAARIVEEHNGTLDATSREGGGATFIITLPIKGS